MEGDQVELTFQKRRRRRQLRCLGIIVGIIVLFFLGFVIGYFSRKVGGSGDGKKQEPDKKGGESMKAMKTHKFHMKFQEEVDETQLKETLRSVKEPLVYPRDAIDIINLWFSDSVVAESLLGCFLIVEYSRSVISIISISLRRRISAISDACNRMAFS